MSDAAQPEAAVEETEAKKPATKQFRNRFSTPRLPAEHAARQGRIAGLAWQKLGGRDAAMAFLNTHDDALGGRPLDLAVASVEGYDAVAKMIDERAGG